MLKSKTTKSAFISSVLSLFLCFAMLIGSTFAWFSDSVSSTNNIITAGNLDVELEYYDGDSWEKVSDNTNVFTNTLWEPGHTEVVYLKVSNLGTLALKYALNINVAEEIESINVAGETLRLSKYIMYDVIEGVTTPYATSEAALTAATADTAFTAVALNDQYYNMTGKLYPADNTPAGEASEKYVALVVYLPQEIGNEANYRTGEVAPKITLGINLFATQQNDNAQHDIKPTATIIETTVANQEMVIADLTSGSPSLAGDGTFTLDAAYEFRALDNAETASYSKYSDWLTDYYVSVDAPIEDGLTLAGYYEGFPWIAIPVPAGNYTDAVGLLGMVSSGGISNWTYADIVAGVNTFMCGVVNTNNANAGKTMTVELRIMNPEDTTEYIVISKTTYTFGTKITNSDELKTAIEAGQTNIKLEPGIEYRMPSSSVNANINISGSETAVLDMTWGAYLENATLNFKGITIKTATGYVTSNGTTFGSDYAALYSKNVSYTDCVFSGPMRVGRDGAKFINCTFTELGNDYVWTYGNDVTFEGCTFNTDGKAILIYSDGGSEVSQVTVKNCVFNSTTGAKASAIANQNCAAIEIHNYGNGVNLVTEGNTYDTNFSGEWRIKAYESGRPDIIVNGKEYTTIAIDGKIMTIDANKNVTVQ